MNLSKEQARKYLEEAELSLEAAQFIFERAKELDKDMWANVIKGCYDAIEQAISAGIAKKNEVIPKEHPFKVKKFINLYKISNKIKNKIYFWLGKRSSSQYVDIKDDKLSVPHELFSEEDAKKALDESEEIIEEIKKLVEEKKSIRTFKREIEKRKC